MTQLISPAEALVDGAEELRLLNVVEHFAGNPKFMGKALLWQDDRDGLIDITADAEDGAKLGKRLELIRAFAEIINDPDKNKYGRIGLRIPDTSQGDWQEVAQEGIKLMGNKLAYITIPKSEDFDDAEEAAGFIYDCAEEEGIERIPLHILIEDPAAVPDVARIARLDWVELLDCGLMDLTSGFRGTLPMECMRSPQQFDHPVIASCKASIIIACAANNLTAAHNVCLRAKDAKQTGEDATRAKEFGFQRMWSIHGNQIGPIIDAMTPSTELISLAVDVLVEAAKNDWGPIPLPNGELGDRATYRWFWWQLRTAHAFKQALPEQLPAAWLTAA